MSRLVIRNSEPYPSFGRKEYLRHVGHFTSGSTQVPFDIIAPRSTAAGLPVVAVETEHPFNGQVVGRDVLLEPYHLFTPGYRYAAITDGKKATPAVLAAFARALRTQLPAVLGAVRVMYGVGFSASGNLLAQLLASPDGAGVFDVSLVGTSGLASVPPAAAGRVMRFDSESDFLGALDAGGVELLDQAAGASHLRWYVATGGPHIAHTDGAANSDVAGCGTPAGTTPINWQVIARAVFVAGDAWARQGAAPPDNRLLVVDRRSGEVLRDALGHARGGARMPSLELAEARFRANASACGVSGHCGTLFGCYSQPRSIGEPGFFATRGQYLAAFGAAAEALVAARLMSRQDRRGLFGMAQRAAARNLTTRSSTPVGTRGRRRSRWHEAVARRARQVRRPPRPRRRRVARSAPDLHGSGGMSEQLEFTVFPELDGTWRFRVVADGRVLATGNEVASRQIAERQVEAARDHAGREQSFVREEAADGRFFFNLLGENRQVLATSERFASADERDEAIDDLLRLGAEAPVSAER